MPQILLNVTTIYVQTMQQIILNVIIYVQTGQRTTPIVVRKNVEMEL